MKRRFCADKFCGEKKYSYLCIVNGKEQRQCFWWYNTFKAYLRLVHETLMIRRRYTIGTENIPRKGERFFITCNHQNTANDPLNIVFALPLRWHICALARANVFELHSLITRFLHWIGLLPAFRFGWEGGQGIERNFSSFNLVAQRINAGQPVIVFPEAGHTQGHWIGHFTTGTVRMAFLAAEADGWQHDIKLLPTAHHYSDYFDVRTDFLWMVDEPISLQPYYETYREHPNETMRQVRDLLYARIHAMMLDEGKTDYEEKDFLRLSAFNPVMQKISLRDKCVNADLRNAIPLPERLEADKQFVEKLCSSPHYAEIVTTTKELMSAEQQLGVTDNDIALPLPSLAVVGWIVALVLLLPLWLISLWPHAVCYAGPPLMLKEDKMFRNSYRYIMSVLILYPLAAIITLAIGIAIGLWWQTMIWIALWLPLGVFSHWYYRHLLRVGRAIRAMRPHDHINSLRARLSHLLTTDCLISK